MYYAKSNPIETIEEHTNKLLENMKLLKELYGVQILNEAKFDKERFWILLEIICTYHDLGKVYTPFQNIIRKQLNEPLLTTEFNYEFVKHEQLSPMFVPIQKYNLTKDEKKLVYQSIYYHHEREGKDINNIYVQEIIEKDIMLQLEKIKNEVPYELPGNINCMYIKYIQNRNRIKQNDELFIEYCLLKGILHRLDHSSSAEMYVEDSTLENIANYVQDFMKKRKYIKNDLQEYCTENSNDNLLVIGSTGMGKTESALFWSNGEKTFFTLPIRTSINAIYDRINESIGYQHIGLLHSTALDYLEEKDEFGNQEEIYRQSQNLSQKITACTIDQIFPFVFKYKGYEKMYATLSYSKLIIDEIQAYSPEIVAIIIKGLEMIYKIGGKFMIMTATLPQIYKNELEKMGIHFQFNKFIKATKRHKIKLEEKDILDDLKDLIEKSKKSKVLIITNTVNKAIDIFLELQELKVENINLLHSRFIYNDRSAKEFKIKKFSENRKENGIWITTQIVEASLDIDFDYLYTEMSTLDSLFQRLGRCYRSREYDGQDANVHIYIENMSGIKYIYDEIFHAPEWTLMDLGDITNDEAIEIINKRNEFKYEKLTQEFLHEWHKKQPINRDIVEIAKILKNNGYNLFVLSNMANQTYEYFKNDEFFSLCTGIVISAHEHVKKPDEKVYRLLLNRYNLNAEECLFIDDDDSGKNYETANKIGIKGRRIMPNQAEDVKKLLLEFNVEI